MKNQTPIKIIPGKGKHRTETRVFVRNIHETWCVQPGCKFNGRPAQQGVCHTTTTFTGSTDWSYIEALEKDAVTHLAELLRRHGRRSYLRRLEEDFICAHLNAAFHLDQLVYLRREVALLRLAVAKAKRCRKVGAS